MQLAAKSALCSNKMYACRNLSSNKNISLGFITDYFGRWIEAKHNIEIHPKYTEVKLQFKWITTYK